MQTRQTSFSFLMALLALAATACPADPPPPPPVVCAPSCEARVCGDDGCGGNCGDCPTGQDCTAQGVCLGEVCDGIKLVGCCSAAGETKWCDNGKISTLPCEGDSVCGWRGEASVYACGFEEDPALDPATPYLCPDETCPADTCADKECGFECGQSCGECATGNYCDAGSCKACSCDGKACGEDECGNSCGDCGAGTLCNPFTQQCTLDLCDGIDLLGCCTGDGKLRYCEGGILKTFGCGQKGVCGWRSPEFGFDCTTDGAAAPAGIAHLCPGVTCAAETPCSGRACGFECGVACGTCAAGEACDDVTGVCQACSCDQKNCGDDGCGNSCGDCPTDQPICDRNTQVCKADQCGQVSSMGCCTGAEKAVDCVNGELAEVDCPEFGSTCGWNGFNYGCTPYQAPSGSDDVPYQCPGEGCAQTCSDIQCGFACGVFCGDCGEGEWCDGSSCKPCTCAGVECGSDGCGNGCGVCPADEVCDEFKGTCDKDGCLFTDYVGCCDGLVQHACGWQGASAVQCAKSCGWDAEVDAYRCGGSGAEPSGTHQMACPAVLTP